MEASWQKAGRGRVKIKKKVSALAAHRFLMPNFIEIN
jgi:hypothetical protein